MDKLLLIDGNSLTYRAYYGSAYSSSGILTNSNGIPVNAVLTLAKMLSKIIGQYKPTHIFVAFDAGKKTKRHDEMPEYKAGRSKTPDELITQMPIVKEMIEKMGINQYQLDGIEADDIIGTIAKKFNNDIEVLVCSSDKDMYQLVDKNITVISPQNGSKPDKIITIDIFENLMGYKPQQVIDIKGLVGDPSDNLKGVAGVGEKSAVKLISEYKTIDGIYENIDKITGKIKDKLVQDEKSAFLCKKIATIMLNIEIPFKLNDMKISSGYSKELFDFFDKYHLPSLVNFFQKSTTITNEKETLLFDNLAL